MRTPVSRAFAGLLLLSPLLAVAACAWGHQPPVTPAPSGAAFVRMGLRPIGGTRSEIRAALGEPERITQEVVPNRHVPGVMDTLFVLHYPGLAAHLHRPGGAGAGDLLSQVDVSDDRYLLFSAPGIGTSLEELEALLGPPTEIDGEGFTYGCQGCDLAETWVKFVVSENRVREVRFLYYVD